MPASWVPAIRGDARSTISLHCPVIPGLSNLPSADMERTCFHASPPAAARACAKAFVAAIDGSPASRARARSRNEARITFSLGASEYLLDAPRRCNGFAAWRDLLRRRHLTAVQRL